MKRPSDTADIANAVEIPMNLSTTSFLILLP